MKKTETPVWVTVWTPDDEAALEEMLSRKSETLMARRAPVLELVRGMQGVYSFDEIDVTDWLINNARQIRATLAPFDSKE